MSSKMIGTLMELASEARSAGLEQFAHRIETLARDDGPFGFGGPALITPKRIKMEYQGADWIRDSLRVDMSPLGESVADLLGFVYRGIYHIHSSLLKKVAWSDPRYVRVSVPTGIANCDSPTLTRLLVVSFDMGLRMEIDSAGARHLGLSFWQRTCRRGSVSSRIPLLREVDERIRSSYQLVEIPERGE